jgi:hypothetical protein
MLPFIPPHVCAFVCETQRDLFPMHAALLFHSLIVICECWRLESVFGFVICLFIYGAGWFFSGNFQKCRGKLTPINHYYAPPNGQALANCWLFAYHMDVEGGRRGREAHTFQLFEC